LFSPNRETKTKVLLADYYSQRGIDSRQSKKKSSNRAFGVLFLLLFVVIATFLVARPTEEETSVAPSSNPCHRKKEKLEEAPIIISSPGPGTRSCDDRDLACDSKFTTKETTPGKHHLEINITNICDRGWIVGPSQHANEIETSNI
jgi:hypothetical protein